MKKIKYVVENFSVDTLTAILHDNIPESWAGTDEEFADNYKFIKSQISDQTRWYTYYDMIFSANGKTYTTAYKRGSTEYQEVDDPFEDVRDGDFVKCVEVEEKEVLVKQYVEKLVNE